MKRPRVLVGVAAAAAAATAILPTDRGLVSAAVAGQPPDSARDDRREMLGRTLGRAGSVTTPAAAPSGVGVGVGGSDPHERPRRRGEESNVVGGGGGAEGAGIRERGGHAFRGRRRGQEEADNIFAREDSGVPIGQPRIVGELDAIPTRYPYSVSLQNSETKQHVCGATLVAPDVLLSAAHCFNVFDTAVIGRYHLYSDEDTMDPDADVVVRAIDTTAITIPPFKGLGGQNGEPWSANETQVNGQAKHPLFTLATGNFDISHDFMLIKLAGGAVNTTKYPPVKINRNATVPTADTTPETLTVIGWGTTESGGFLSNVLREADLSYLTNDACELSQGNVSGTMVGYGGFIEGNMMCAFRENNDKCLGDGGAPLLQLGARAVESDGGGATYSPNDLQVGIAMSFSIGCGNPDFPGIYSRISDQSKWIDHAVCAMSDDLPADFRISCDETDAPTVSPSATPSASPTVAPTTGPTMSPSDQPTDQSTDPPVAPLAGATGNEKIGNKKNENKKNNKTNKDKKPGNQRKKKRKKRNKKNTITPAPTSLAPTQAPTSLAPTFEPTVSPTVTPTPAPTVSPTTQPSTQPSSVPPTTPPTSSAAPSEAPSPEGGPVGATSASVSIAGVGGGGRPFNATPGCKSALYWDCDASLKTGSPASTTRLGGAARMATVIGMACGALLTLFP